GRLRAEEQRLRVNVEEERLRQQLDLACQPEDAAQRRYTRGHAEARVSFTRALKELEVLRRRGGRAGPGGGAGGGAATGAAAPVAGAELRSECPREWLASAGWEAEEPVVGEAPVEGDAGVEEPVGRGGEEAPAPAARDHASFFPNERGA